MVSFENFSTPKAEITTQERQERRSALRELAAEIIKEDRVFTWPELSPEAYERLKTEEDEFPGYVTPIDDVIERCQKEGVKVFIDDVNIVILPAETGDLRMDIIYPHSLQITAYMDGQLSELIHVSKLLKR